jgi:hypothetical protein
LLVSLSIRIRIGLPGRIARQRWAGFRQVQGKGLKPEA